MDEIQHTELRQSYEQRLSQAIERMTNRVGGHFVHNDRWADVVREPSHTDDNNRR